MSIEKLDRKDWHPYFDSIARLWPGMQAEIDVQSLKIGAHVESEFAPLIGIVYDQKSEILEVALEGWDHTIPNVAEIWIDHDGIMLKSIKVVDTDGTEQVVKLRHPQSLPAPQAAPGSSPGMPR